LASDLQEDDPLRTTRRQFLYGISTLALAASLSAMPAMDFAAAQTISSAELMQAGPLGDKIMGKDDAPVTMIEYASATCSHCATFKVKTFPKLKEKYIDTGKVRFIFREFPFDPVAAGAFMLARCAPEDKYFAVLDLLFQTQAQWAVEKPLGPLLTVAKQAGFTEDSFKACLSNQKVLDGIEWVRNRAADKFKVDSTPTFFINGQVHKGAMSMEEVDKVLAGYLKS
jgi:protein-disulfide isomerase